jgi:hypothetical protein
MLGIAPMTLEVGQHTGWKSGAAEEALGMLDL